MLFLTLATIRTQQSNRQKSKGRERMETVARTEDCGKLQVHSMEKAKTLQQTTMTGAEWTAMAAEEGQHK